MPKGEYSEETWEQIRQDYEAGISTNALSKKYGPARPSIDYRARTQGWSRDPLLQEAVARTAAAAAKAKGNDRPVKRAGLLFSADPLEPSARAAGADKVERIARDRLQLVEDHQDSWVGIDEIYEDAMRLLRGEPTRVLVRPQTIYAEDGTTILEKAEVLTLTKRVNLAFKLIALYEGASRGLMTKQEGERRAFGFDYKTQVIDASADEEGRRRRRELADSVVAMVEQAKKMAQQGSSAPPEAPPTVAPEVSP